MQPIVSVITISLNSENTIENTIKSVLNQTYKNIEYIVIDGGSVDNTIRVINKYSHAIAKIISEKDKGIYDAFNKGLNISAGEYIQFVNSDDILDREKIANCVHYMQRNPHTDIINGDLNMINSSGETYEIIKGKKPDFWTKLEMTGMNHPTYFVRTSVYNDHKFNMFRIGMDFDWTLRVIASGHKFGYLASNRVL
jgi:glycosyltransferase involved in cell wall biosynthesis